MIEVLLDILYVFSGFAMGCYTTKWFLEGKNE